MHPLRQRHSWRQRGDAEGHWREGVNGQRGLSAMPGRCEAARLMVADVSLSPTSGYG